jgi:hypothetical protein
VKHSIQFDSLKFLPRSLSISKKKPPPPPRSSLYTVQFSYTEKSGLGGKTSDAYSGGGLNLGQDIG